MYPLITTIYYDLVVPRVICFVYFTLCVYAFRSVHVCIRYFLSEYDVLML